MRVSLSLIAALTLGLVVGGCGKSPQEIEDAARANGFEDNLPEGCKLKVPGRVNGDLIVIIVCEKRTTTSALRTWTTTHHNHTNNTMEIEHHRSHVIHISAEG